MGVVNQPHWTESGGREVFLKNKIKKYSCLYVWLCRGFIVAHELSGCKLIINGDAWTYLPLSVWGLCSLTRNQSQILNCWTTTEVLRKA